MNTEILISLHKKIFNLKQTLFMKRKKFLLVLLPLLIIHLSVLSQIQVGLMGGPQFSTREYKFGSASNGFITSINAGITSLIPFSKKIVLQGMLGYSGKGVIIKEFTFNDALGNDMGKGNINILLNYIELRSPVNYAIDLSPKSKFLIGAGPFFSYAVGGHQKIMNNDFFAVYLDKEIDFEDEYNRFELGVTGNINLQLHKKWLLGACTDVGVTDIFKIESSTTTSHISFSVTLGYLFFQQQKKENKK
jgi:hypothetical protein